MVNEKKESSQEVERQGVVSQDCEQDKKNERKPAHLPWRYSFISWMRNYGELISEIVLMCCVAGVCYSMVCLVEIISLFA